MFDRRVKIFLVVLIVATAVLVLRAVQVQVVDRVYWNDEAIKMKSSDQLIETTRGRLLDRMGRVIAEDSPCIDACVDYRAITREPDAKWVEGKARERLRDRFGSEYARVPKAERERLLNEEVQHVKDDIQAMWVKLAEYGNISMDEMNDRRQTIVLKIEYRRRHLWYDKYRQAMEKQGKQEPSPWYQRWLMDETQDAHALDEYEIQVGEQTQPHVILPAISNEVNNQLGKRQDQFPGLVLQRSTHRTYPYQDIAAHAIGQLSHINREDQQADAHKDDQLRKYWPNDMIGRTGLEALCEPLLRGVRGRVDRIVDENNTITNRVDPVPGGDVKTTIDIELQRDIQQIFTRVLLTSSAGQPPWEDKIPMPGAAVVIDVPTGEILALVSYPTYDLNTIDEKYSELVNDLVNYPLLNRATQVAMEPGSTVKPMVGLGAITDGLFPPDVTIECTGYLVLNGHKYNVGRCWVTTNFAGLLPSVAHHPIPLDDPHPTGFLTFEDALERSCNVFFETMADKLGMDGLAKWYGRFGLGRPTGVGIAEIRGEIPNPIRVTAAMRRAATWFSGIGQSQVRATPIQMANVSATIARDGIWVRPHLVSVTIPSTRSTDPAPDRVDLQLSPAALAKAKLGMYRVVNTRAGTGNYHELSMLGIPLAGKTGSAQAAPLKLPRIGDDGKVVYETFSVPVEDAQTGEVRIEERKRPFMDSVTMGTHEHPNPLVPWYRGSGVNQDRRSHAWYMGFAPADHPRIAFAVMIQYGGGGGATAGYVAKQLLDECIKHGYLAR